MRDKPILLNLLCIALIALFLCGCTTEAPAAPASPRETRREFLSPEAPGELVFERAGCRIDASRSGRGYVMARYDGEAQRARLQITTPGGVTYGYNLRTGSEEYFPLSGGDGEYRVDLLEQVDGNMYALMLSENVAVTLEDEFLPFLYPNQYVWFTARDRAVKLGMELSESSASDIDYVERVYFYVTENISYDRDLAENISLDYLPVIDRTLESNKGICFDYASLMASLLRSQGIPTKLVVGYSGSAYHAWISVYLSEIGWVDRIIEFDGRSWSLMDPTLAAGNDRKSVEKYIGDGSGYIVKYEY